MRQLQRERLLGRSLSSLIRQALSLERAEDPDEDDDTDEDEDEEG